MGNAHALTVTVANQKGGAGKTAVAANLAITLAREMPPALAIDLDPQASLTRQLAYPAWQTGGLGAHDVLMRRESLPAALVASQWAPDTLAVLAGAQELADVGQILVAKSRREDRLRAALDEIAEDVSVVIDTPADLGPLVANGLAVRPDLVLLPVSGRDEGALRGVLETVALAREVCDPLPTFAAVLTQFLPTRHASRDVDASLGAIEDAGVTILSTRIAEAAVFHQAGTNHRPVVDTNPDGVPAAAFRSLLAEIRQLTTETTHA